MAVKEIISRNKPKDKRLQKLPENQARKTRQAGALRANLQRRKAGPVNGGAQPNQVEPGE